MEPKDFLITDEKRLALYRTETRKWQGIPSVEVTRGGRIFTAHYSGGTGEMPGNYVPISLSDDGEHFTEPVAVFFAGNDRRCYDPSLWVDPKGRLWAFFSVMPDYRVYASVLAEPDAEKLVWTAPREVGVGVMMNKPIALASGRWLLPLAIWTREMLGVFGYNMTEPDKYGPISAATAVASDDEGETFRLLGGADGINRSFDEHMLLEKKDGSLAMYTRTHYGIGVSRSRDGGVTWDEIADSHLGGPDSRFHLRRLPSGRVLLVNHDRFSGRSRMAAMLSEDDGKTFPHCLLLDERSDVTYPDAALHGDGIYIIYDRGRYTDKELLMARVTEAEILAGKLSDPKSYLKRIVNKAPADNA